MNESIFVVKSIMIYPIKGMKGILLNASKVLERGLEYDRRWMLVDDRGEFITQRTDSRMALFSCKLGSQLEVSFKEDSIKIDLEECSSVKKRTVVWDVEVMTYEVSRKISDWFSLQLGFSCHLVKMVDEFDRYKDLIKGPSRTRVSFADGYPYLFVGTASLDLLTEKAGELIPSDRFRANIVVETQIPHEEDDWDCFLLGSAKFQVIKPCVRCNVINIDQSSGSFGKEPLRTLSTYRMESNNIYFGANVICIQEGSIKSGDKLCT